MVSLFRVDLQIEFDLSQLPLIFMSWSGNFQQEV